jgi:hypothetical protein
MEMSRTQTSMFLTLLMIVVAASLSLAQGGLPPGPPAGGQQPGEGWQGRPQAGNQAQATPVMLLAPDKYLYVIYGGVLFQFDANDLKLLNQTRLMPMGERGGRPGEGGRGEGGRGEGGRGGRPAGQAPAGAPAAPQN